jgi:hypothetical protein
LPKRWRGLWAVDGVDTYHFALSREQDQITMLNQLLFLTTSSSLNILDRHGKDGTALGLESGKKNSLESEEWPKVVLDF